MTTPSGDEAQAAQFAAVNARQHSPLLDLSTPADRTDFLRLLTFVHYLRIPAVQDALREREMLLPADLRNVFATLLDHLGVTQGIELGSTTTFNLNQLIPALDSLERIMASARRLPAHIFPEEARPTAEFMVRCQNIAGNNPRLT